MSGRLDESSLKRGLSRLVRIDADLARVFEQYGAPPLWVREQGFATLLRVILEQQVSLASAEAAYNRLLAAASPLGPETFLPLDDVKLKEIGFSRQKAHYCRELARSISEGRINLSALEKLSDEEARGRLLKLKGVGPWTAEIYLLMALRRVDAWPAGDLALAVAAQSVKRLPVRPTPDELEELAASWRPWRAVAAHLLWHRYLMRRSEVASKSRSASGAVGREEGDAKGRIDFKLR